MVQDAKEHEAEDKKIKETIEARNKLDGLILNTEKSMKEHGDKISDEQKDLINKELEQAKKDLKEKDQDIDALNKSYESLMTAAQKLAEAMYKQAGEQKDNHNNNNSSNDNGQGPIDVE
jgi:molecular chaperone DnaK